MKISPRVLTVATAALIFASCLTAARAQEAKPLGLVAISSYDELMADIDFLGTLADVPNASQNLEMPINMFTQNQGLVGLDKTKPLGVVLHMSEGAPMPGGAVCIPVTDMDGLLGVLVPFGVQGQDKGNGTYEISANGQTMYARTQDGWAFIAPMEQMLDALPANPGQTIIELNKEYDVGVRVNIQNIPEAQRQQFVELFSQAAEQGVQQEAGESDADFAERADALRAQVGQIEQQIADMDTVTLGLAIDGEQQRAFFDLVYTALPNTKLAEQLAINADTKTNFAGFFQPDSAMMASFASQVGEADAAQLDQQIASARQQIFRSIDKEDELASDESKQLMKDAVDDFIGAVKSTLEDGMLDGGAVLTLDPNALTFVAGGIVVDAGKVEDGLKKMAEASEKENLGMPAVNWNAETYGDMKFHTMSHPTDADDEGAQRLFGDAVEMAVGIGENSVFFALGRNWFDAVKKVVDDSKANPNKSVPPMELTVSLGPIFSAAAEVADEEDQPQMQMIADMLSNEAPGRDKVRVTTTTIPNGARVRFELEEGVMRAIGLAAMQAQMQAAGAPGGGF